MKIRNGFVSNSSTSSFICDFCGAIVSERDLSMQDAGMMACENGHVFCEEESNFNFDFSEEFLKELMDYIKNKNYYDDFSKDTIAYIEKYLNNEIELSELEDYFDCNDIIYIIKEEWGIPERYCPVCQRKHDMEKDSDYIKYKELFEKFNRITPYGTATVYKDV